ncbi:MAG: CRISPR-associated protein Csx16, partial [Patescibacteria group bacterium]
MKHVIVSRHAAAIQFIRETAPALAEARVVESATEADVAGQVVYGNLPLHLAALAAEVNVIE